MIALIEAAPAIAASTPMVIAGALDLLAKSISFDGANLTLRRILIPLATAFSEADLERLVSIAEGNGEVEHAFETYPLFLAVRDAGQVTGQRFREIIGTSDLGARYQDLAAERSALEADEDDVAAGRDNSRAAAVELNVGLRVRHRKFGRGVITALSGVGRDRKVRVQFEEEDVGTKTLVATVANLAIAVESNEQA